ncbi:protein NEDD1-like [Sitophilus oryzae]|uniref:Protein NEDD1-like n=1 Tax=Sitophilus oryzae TaxID=7048 RepID=A0A6J2YMX7_SITOR|nr:protein NEDD1-like [Sitophilus oryzae]
MRMFIGSSSTVVKFHEIGATSVSYTFEPTSKVDGPCRSISWSKDGNWLAVVPHLGFAEIITLKGHCKLLQTVQDVIEPSCASFQNLTKRNIAVGTKHGQVLLYDVKSKSIKSRYPRTTCSVTHVGFTAKDTHCYAGCSNGDLLLFNNVAKSLSCTMKVPKSNSLTSVQAHSQRRNFFVGGSNEGIVAVWDTNVNKVKFYNDAHKAPVTSTIFSPINAALVISAGLDRQVCVFDVDDRQRIACIPVENNVTSLDFTEDATHIAMGSQNGKMHVYDSRNLQTPVYSFEAHESAIRHLAFQNSSSDSVNNNSSVGSIVTEEVSRPSRSTEAVAVRKKRTSDIFGVIVEANAPDNDISDSPRSSVLTTQDGGDSFIQALGLDKNDTADSMKFEESIHENKSRDCLSGKRTSLSSFTPNPTRTVHEKLGLYDSKSIKQSTPKILAENFPPVFSPITSEQNRSKSQAVLPTVSGIQTITKEAVQDEVKKAIDDLRSDIKQDIMQSGAQIRRMMLDFHLAMVKEFMKMENYCNSIRNEINPDAAINRDSYLLEENMHLKKKIEELEIRIANFSNKSDVTSDD